MKKNIIMILTMGLVLASCSSVHEDPYLGYADQDIKGTVARYDEKKQVVKEAKKEVVATAKKVEVAPNVVIPDATKENKGVESTLTDAEKAMYKKIYDKIETKNPISEKDYKNIQIKTAEIHNTPIKKVEKEVTKVVKEPKKVIKPVVKPVVVEKKVVIETPTVTVEKTKDEEKIIPKYTKEDYENISLNQKDEKILNLIKKHYGMMESYDIMALKTKELIYKIRKEQDSDISSTKVLQQVHEMIKETKTKSFVLAVDRVEKNRGLK